MLRPKTRLHVAWLSALLISCNPPESPTPFTPEAEAAASLIDGSIMRETILEIADDRYEGRGPGTDGDRMTREYLARRLEAMGYAPGGPNGSWEQTFDLVGLTATQPATWTFSSDDGQSVELAQSDDFIVASGVQAAAASVVDAELVFAGFAIQAPEYDWDDFKGVDLEGKLLVIVNNDPDWDPDLFEGITRLYYGRWTYKYESAARQGAAGAIIIHTDPSAGYPWQVVQTSWSGEQFELPDDGEPRIDLKAWVTEDAARELFAAAEDYDALIERAKQRDFEPVPLGLTTSLTLPVEVQATETANVLGVLRGSDPALADEYVIFTAHHDHLGIGQPSADVDPNDRIYNGAMDNASGVGQVLAIGNALASLDPGPRRSIMLLFVGAEEQGLLGSEYFATYPTVEPGRMAANVNLDGANIWGRAADMTFIGLGKSTLDAVAERVAEYQDRTLKPDEFPDRGYYYRSDQFNFAKIGVPAFYFDGGTEIIGRPEGWGVEQINLYTDRDYHQPSDEYDESWNFEGMVEDARFAFWAGLIVANADEMPSWYPGDEFEAAREEALDVVRDIELEIGN